MRIAEIGDGTPGTGRRRARWKIAITLALALLLAAGGCSRQPEKPKNLLLITIDTLRADRLGCYGAAAASTPNIDRLAREGTLFTDAFCSIPITLPSHCSILTGLYPRTHKVLSHGYTLGEEQVTLAELLKENGYKTAAFVSSHVLDDKYGVNQGFDLYFQRYNYGAKRIRNLLRNKGEDLLTQAILDWIRLELDEPYFLWIHWFHPHKPYEPPPPMDALVDPERGGEAGQKADVKTLEKAWKGEIDLTGEEVERFRSLYAGEVAFTDRQVGLVLSGLKESGGLENTVVLFTADHGEVLYEHDRYFGHDIMLYDRSLRVPLIVREPDRDGKSEISGATVRNIDILPGALDLLGIDRSGLDLEGRSFAPALGGGTLPDAPVFAEVFPPKEDWKSEPRHAVRFDGWKLITVDGVPEGELFDLAADPGEAENLIREREGLRDRMTGLLDEWMGKTSISSGGFPTLSDEERENLEALGYIEESP